MVNKEYQLFVFKAGHVFSVASRGDPEYSLLPVAVTLNPHATIHK